MKLSGWSLAEVEPAVESAVRAEGLLGEELAGQAV
jgi:hypothetical protein